MRILNRWASAAALVVFAGAASAYVAPRQGLVAADLVGVWHLTNIGSEPLPVPMIQTTTFVLELTSDTLRMLANGTFARVITTRMTAGDTVTIGTTASSGTYTIGIGTAMAFTTAGPASTFTVVNASREAGVLTLTTQFGASSQPLSTWSYR